MILYHNPQYTIENGNMRISILNDVLLCRECFPSHRLQRKTLVSDPDMHHDTLVTHVTWCMSTSLTHSGGENVPGIPGIPGTSAIRDFRYLARGRLWDWWGRSVCSVHRPGWRHQRVPQQHVSAHHSVSNCIIVSKNVTVRLMQVSTIVTPKWWRHQMETFSAIVALGVGNSLFTGEFQSQKPGDTEFLCFLWSAPGQMVEQTIDTPVTCTGTGL